MLKIYEYENWNDENLKAHNDRMINILIDSFPESFAQIRGNLKNQIFQHES